MSTCTPVPGVIADRGTISTTTCATRCRRRRSIRLRPTDESPEVGWFDFEVAQERCEPALAPVIAKLARWYRARDVRD